MVALGKRAQKMRPFEPQDSRIRPFCIASTLGMTRHTGEDIRSRTQGRTLDGQTLILRRRHVEQPLLRPETLTMAPGGTLQHRNN